MCNESLSLINTVRHCGRYSRIVAINFLFASLGWYSIYTPSTCTTYSNYKPFYVEIIAFKTDDGLQINVSQAKNHSSVSFASKLRKKIQFNLISVSFCFVAFSIFLISRSEIFVKTRPIDFSYWIFFKLIKKSTVTLTKSLSCIALICSAFSPRVLGPKTWWQDLIKPQIN